MLDGELHGDHLVLVVRTQNEEWHVPLRFTLKGVLLFGLHVLLVHILNDSLVVGKMMEQGHPLVLDPEGFQHIYGLLDGFNCLIFQFQYVPPKLNVLLSVRIHQFMPEKWT